MLDIPIAEQDVVLEGILAVARRETLVVAAALQVPDEDGALVATTRLLWALANAHQFAARSVAGFGRAHPRLTAVIETARPWLPTEPKIALSQARFQCVLERMLEPSMRLDPIDASNALLLNLDLDDLPLAQLIIRGARVTDVHAQRAQLEALDATAATLTRCNFAAASLRGGAFEHAIVEDCDLSRTNLERGRWNSARVSRCKATRACLIEARLDGATFIDCDFRDADFESGLLATTRAASSARFLRCDLRGTNWTGRSLGHASFFDCKLHGAHGATDLISTPIERPDLSPQGDGSLVGTKKDIASRWISRSNWTEDASS